MIPRVHLLAVVLAIPRSRGFARGWLAYWVGEALNARRNCNRLAS